MEHFRVLPTDERYTQLSFRQKELLFLSFLILPTDEEYRKSYPNVRRAPDIPDEVLQGLGYDLDEAKKIKEELKGT